MALFYSLTNILHKFFINQVQYIFQKSYNFVFFNITWLKKTYLSTGAFYTTKIQRFGQKCQVISHYSCEYFKYIHQHNLMRIPILPSSPFLERHPQQTKRGKMQITIDITTQLTPKGCVSWLMYNRLSLELPTVTTKTCTQTYILFHTKQTEGRSPMHIRKIRRKEL